MGYDNDCILEIDQEFLQPCNRIQIQVVCRLVEKKDIRISEEGSCKENLYLFITIQILHQGVVVLWINTKTI